MIHPIEGRYGRSEVKGIFEDNNRFQRWMEVEAALANAHAKVGNIPQKDADNISKQVNAHVVKVERIKEIEDEINHDVMAMVKALTELCGDSGKYIHLGATSNDITDTALALQFKEYIPLLKKSLKDLLGELKKKIKEHKGTVCIGRTHAQHAVPTTYGLKFSIYAMEIARNIERLNQISKRLLVGQMTGAVGTQAAFGPKAVQIQKLTMKYLGLGCVDVSNQIIQRDRHAEFLMLLALIAQTLNKIALEIRNLQRTEIDEIREGFGKKQVGSSTMPHKMNPIYAERIGGVARVIKADAVAALDNIPLWHERDLTNSSCERMIIPESCILTDYILQLSINLIRDLVFNKENIERNLGLTQGRVMAESIMIALSNKGMGRQTAHAVVRESALESYKSKKPFRDFLLEDTRVTDLLSVSEVDKALDPHNYVGTAVKQAEAVLKKLS